MAKNKDKQIEEAVRLVWDSLQSHLVWTYTHCSEGHAFHKKAIKDYTKLLSIIVDFYNVK